MARRGVKKVKEESGINGILNALDLMNNIELVDIAVQTDPIRIPISAPSIAFEERKQEPKQSQSLAPQTHEMDEQIPGEEGDNNFASQNSHNRIQALEIENQQYEVKVSRLE